ncbi:MAG TPA: hypothetical protein VL527_17395, partial [Dongiaceae bacterium]|nr:hypothetical protein [Dongiaceae bacterium]
AVAMTGIILYRRYTGLSQGKAALLWLLGVALTVGFVIYEQQQNETHNYRNIFGGPISLSCLACAIGLPLLGLPFLVRLHRKWIGGQVTEAEKLPGSAGVRAWLGAGNIICAALLAICLNQLFGVSFLAATTLTFGLLLIYPLLMLATDPAATTPAAPGEDLSHEREKVLQLLESGRITAEESAELLNALGQSVPARPPAPKEMEMTPQRKLVLLGAALLLIGFFLPWFSINLNAEVTAAQEVIQQQLPQMPNMQFNVPQLASTTRVTGGDIGHGLGWWVLLLGIAAAILPFFATNLNGPMQKKVMLACLGVGAVILVYLFTNNLRFISIGILAGLAGYALELIGTLRERSPLQ